MKKSLPNDLLIPEVAELIRQGHTVTLTARGNSMNPFIVDRRDRRRPAATWCRGTGPDG